MLFVDSKKNLKLMKTRSKMFINMFLVSFLLGSCKVSYINTYYTYLENSPNESLQFKDSIISISFDPKTNGIKFDIENLTKNNLYLIWDKSYFIEPNGSSAKPLNTDVLETNSVIRDKENYESVLPQGGHFVRFTCPAKNISLFSMYNSITLYNEVTNSTTTNADYSKFYLTGTYWNLGSTYQYDTKNELLSYDKTAIALVQKFISVNNNLGVGFTIRNGTKEIEYHFKFPIKKVVISRKTSDEYMYVLRYELSKDYGFQATPIK